MHCACDKQQMQQALQSNFNDNAVIGECLGCLMFNCLDWMKHILDFVLQIILYNRKKCIRLTYNFYCREREWERERPQSLFTSNISSCSFIQSDALLNTLIYSRTFKDQPQKMCRLLNFTADQAFNSSYIKKVQTSDVRGGQKKFKSVTAKFGF